MGHGVLLHDGGEVEEGALLEEVELRSRLAIDLQGSRVQAGPVGVLEAVPAKFPRRRAEMVTIPCLLIHPNSACKCNIITRH